ncbi:MAG: hypothetical protein ABSC03_17405 [Verrucomicrobiota bacterium]|jgi:hypothetical protein
MSTNTNTANTITGLFTGEKSNFESTFMAVALVVLTIVLIARVRAKKGRAFWRFKPSAIENRAEAKTIVDYIKIIAVEHWVEYLVIVFIPVILALLMQNTITLLVGLWGLLITTLSAFYSHRADYFSNKALRAANQTYNAVINFAENLEQFVERVKHDLGRMHGPVKIKFLTIIPAFGAVGLRDYYSEMKGLQNDYQDFHSFLARKLAEHEESKIEILTYDGVDTEKWIYEIIRTTRGNITPTNKNTIEAEVKELYAVQREYALHMIGLYGGAKLDWRIWNTNQLPKMTGKPKQAIPFQFLIVQHLNETRLYFLFSGSFFYDFVFQAVEVPVAMTSLVMLTKGYYVHDDGELIPIFRAIFDSLFTPMNHIADGNNAYN